MFCLYLILTFLSIMAYSFLRLSSSFLSLTNFLKIVLMYDSSVLKLIQFFFFSVVTNVISLCFLTFSIVFLNTELFINLTKSYSKSFFISFLNFVFKSIFDFSHIFVKTQLLCVSFLISFYYLMLVLKLLCVFYLKYFSLSSILQRSCSTFPNFFLFGKKWQLSMRTP